MINSRFLKLLSLFFWLAMLLFSPLQLQAYPLSSSIISPFPSKQQTILNSTFPSFSYSPHEPIEITNDSALASTANSGTGTEICDAYGGCTGTRQCDGINWGTCIPNSGCPVDCVDGDEDVHSCMKHFRNHHSNWDHDYESQQRLSYGPQ